MHWWPNPFLMALPAEWNTRGLWAIWWMCLILSCESEGNARWASLKCDRFWYEAATLSPRLWTSQTGGTRLNRNRKRWYSRRWEKAANKRSTQVTGPEVLLLWFRSASAFQDYSAGRGKSNQCDAKGIFNAPHTNCDWNECASYWVIWCVAVVYLLLHVSPYRHIQNMMNHPHYKRWKGRGKWCGFLVDPDIIYFFLSKSVQSNFFECGSLWMKEIMKQNAPNGLHYQYSRNTGTLSHFTIKRWMY